MRAVLAFKNLLPHHPEECGVPATPLAVHEDAESRLKHGISFRWRVSWYGPYDISATDAIAPLLRFVVPDRFEVYVRDADLRCVGDFVRGPENGWPRLAGDADDVLDDIAEIGVDAE